MVSQVLMTSIISYTTPNWGNSPAFDCESSERQSLPCWHPRSPQSASLQLQPAEGASGGNMAKGQRRKNGHKVPARAESQHVLLILNTLVIKIL